MKKAYTYFFLLLVLVGFAHIDGGEMESTINSPITKNHSEMSIDELKQTLMEAITQNNEEEVSRILAHPKAKNFGQYNLRNALELAAENNYVHIAHTLIEAGADIKDSRYSKALQNAAEKGYKDMVKALLPVSGCDKHFHRQFHYVETEVFNYYRDEALMLAARNGHVEVMKELINAGADPNCQTSFFGNIALVEAVKNRHVGAVKELLQAKANVNAADRNGETAVIVVMHLRSMNIKIFDELFQPFMKS